MKEEYGRIYADLYRGHWWWRARESIVVREIERLDLRGSTQVLDVGCGNGLFLEKLGRWGEVTGIEVDRALVTDDAPHRSSIFHEPLGDRRYDELRCDLVVCLDVLEHVRADAAFVERLVARLKPGGYLVLTVPAFMALWDEHDEHNQHHRRYRREHVRSLLEPHGALLACRYVFPSLFLPKLLVASINRRREHHIEQAQIPHPAVTRLVSSWLRFEDRIARALHSPFGTSVLAVMQRWNDTDNASGG